MSKNKELPKVFFASYLIYLGFRVLGATKKHAWDRARVATAEGIMDHVIEATGIMHPKHKDKIGEQVTFEGGPADRVVRFVDGGRAGRIEWQAEDGKRYLYRRTDRKRADSVIFALDYSYGD